MQPVDNRVEALRDYLTGQGLSPTTIRNYSGALARAVAWADSSGADLEDLTNSETATLAGIFPPSNSSRRHLRAALVHYWDMLNLDGPVKAIRVPPRPTPRWRGLEDDQVADLLDVARGDWPRGGVVYLGLYLGLRREEIATLRWRDFDDDLAWARIQGKADRVRWLPVHDELAQLLRSVRWPGEWVFPGRLGGHISLATVNNWIRQLGDAARIDGLHPHQLRHTAGGKVNDSLRDIYAAQGFLGHAQVETTQVYSRLARDRLVDAVRTFDDWTPDPVRETPSNVIELKARR